MRQIDPSRDGKLRQIRSQIRKRAAQPTIDTNGDPNRKLLIFTTFKDTAEYLYNNLLDLAKEELNTNIAMVAGDQCHTTHGRGDFHGNPDQLRSRR